MAEDQAAGVPPAAETAILALGAGAAGPEPAAAPGMGMGQGGGGPPPAAAAAAAGRTAAALPPQPLIAASPGLGQGADVRVQLESGMFAEGVITGRRRHDGTYPVAICHSHGQRGSTGYLFHVRQFLTVPEYNQRYAEQRASQLAGAPRLPAAVPPPAVPPTAPAARAPARYTSDVVPQDFGFDKDSCVGKAFGGAASYLDKCWPPFLLLAQSVAKEYLDQDVQTLVAAVEQTLEAAAGEGVELAPKDFTIFDDVRIELRVHVLRLGATLKEVSARRAKKQKIEDPSSRQPAAVGLRVMEELLDGPLAQRAKALCGRLEESDSCAVAATAALSKPPEGEFERAIQRVARSAGSCEVVSKATHGNTLFTLRRGAEEGMEALAHRADFGKVPPGTARAGPASKKGATWLPSCWVEPMLKGTSSS